MSTPRMDLATGSRTPRRRPFHDRELPEIDLRQLRRLTDDTGILQHAVYATPDANHGYCIDDNARAMIAGLLHADLRGHDESLVPLHTYLAFLAYAFNAENGRFRNFMSYGRQWLEEQGSHDSQGRTLWALGLTAHLAPDESIRLLAVDLYNRALPGLAKLEDMRSWAFAIQGLTAFLQAQHDHDASRQLRDDYAQRLFDRFQDHATADWPWWEDLVTYDNAKLCHALLLAGAAMEQPAMTEAGLEALRWLLKVQTRSDDQGTARLSIIGNDGWLRRDGQRANYDQQPLEAYAMVDACLEAARLTRGDERADWEGAAWMALDWFTGRNDLGKPMYDPATGGCRDGLHATGPNHNQGAESSLAYLLAVLELHQHH